MKGHTHIDAIGKVGWNIKKTDRRHIGWDVIETNLSPRWNAVDRRRPGNYMGCQFRAFADRLLGVLGGVGDGREFRQ